MQNFKQKFDAILMDTLDITQDRIIPEAIFKDDFRADSLDMVELAMTFETEFGIIIPDEHIDKIITVADAENYLAEKLKATPIPEDLKGAGN